MADVDVCFWCLKPLKEGEEFHKGTDRMIMRSYTPCKTCKDVFSHGIRLIGTVKEAPMEGMPPIGMGNDNEPLYPTGIMFLAPEEMVREMLNEPDESNILNNVLEHKVMLMPEENVAKIIDTVKNAGAGAPLTDEELEETASMETKKVENKLGIPIV